MAIFLRQSYNVKPPRWGSPLDVQYAIKVNAEKVYDVDPDSIVLAMPLFWGLPCLDYSGKRNDGVNHGAYYKDGELEFDGFGDYVNITSLSGYTSGENLTIYLRFKASSVDGTFNILFDREFTFRLAIDAISKIRCYFGEGTWGNTTSGISDNIVVVDQSFFVVATLDVTNNVARFYVDAVENANYVETKNPITSDYARIGAYSEAVSHNFPGLISEVGFAKAVRTADQIALFHALPYGLYQRVARRKYFFVTGIPVFMHHYNQMRAA